MSAYRTILFLASAESEHDDMALRKLTQSFVGPNAAVYLLHVEAHHVTGFGQSTARGHIANDMQIKQEVFPRLKMLGERYALAPNHIHIEVGDLLPVVERFVRDFGIELLVVTGTQASNSKVAALLDACHCDLHIIR